ncbi:MAG: 4-hydroxythreonine-4-phosphate dehydrogenase PdxA, partial [Pseudomonadota bacterium]
MAHLDPVQSPATPPVVVTLGDALGIGPEIIVRAFLDGRTGPAGQTLVLGEPAVLRRAAAVWRQRADVPELPIAVIDSVADLPLVPPGALPVLLPSWRCPELAQAPWGT